jgi:hypothetical protein
MRSNYHDFGLSFANEKLRGVHGITMSTESVRRLMIQAPATLARIGAANAGLGLREQ